MGEEGRCQRRRRLRATGKVSGFLRFEGTCTRRRNQLHEEPQRGRGQEQQRSASHAAAAHLTARQTWRLWRSRRFESCEPFDQQSQFRNSNSNSSSSGCTCTQSRGSERNQRRHVDRGKKTMARQDEQRLPADHRLLPHQGRGGSRAGSLRRRRWRFASKKGRR